MKQVFKTRYFQRWMRKTELTDEVLIRAVEEMASGLIDADLGSGVIKKRIGLAGRGKSGGVRTIIATNRDDRWFFVFGFEKNRRANIDGDELESLQKLAKNLLSLNSLQIDGMKTAKEIVEIGEIGYGSEKR